MSELPQANGEGKESKLIREMRSRGAIIERSQQDVGQSLEAFINRSRDNGSGDELKVTELAVEMLGRYIDILQNAKTGFERRKQELDSAPVKTAEKMTPAKILETVLAEGLPTNSPPHVKKLLSIRQEYQTHNPKEAVDSDLKRYAKYIWLRLAHSHEARELFLITFKFSKHQLEDWKYDGDVDALEILL